MTAQRFLPRTRSAARAGVAETDATGRLALLAAAALLATGLLALSAGRAGASTLPELASAPAAVRGSPGLAAPSGVAARGPEGGLPGLVRVQATVPQSPAAPSSPPATGGTTTPPDVVAPRTGPDSGVITPGRSLDPGIHAPAPNPSQFPMPVVKPPGTPGGNPAVVPK